MAALTFQSIAERQIRLLTQVCETLTTRALTGQRSHLEDLFLAQGHLEHWLQYLSPLALEGTDTALDAPPPMPSMRPAPSLADVDAAWPREEEETARPRVQFPPEPIWVEDLERDQSREP